MKGRREGVEGTLSSAARKDRFGLPLGALRCHRGVEGGMGGFAGASEMKVVR